jgi:hypothetical protein
MWNEFQQQHFNLQAMLFVTIQDGSALGSISAQAFKGYKGLLLVIKCIYLLPTYLHFI